jgi:dTDP-4-dehydrorhamnose reductase
MVIGAKGMLGTDLVDSLRKAGDDPIAMDVEEIDIRDPNSVSDTLRRVRPGVVFNCAALTDVDGCETNQEQAFLVNATGPENLARACADVGPFLYHISTDYVFDGRKRAPYSEDDPVNPLGVYARSKTAGEQAVGRILPNRHCIVRTQWLFGTHGGNFVETILNQARKRSVLKVVDDQYGSPTYALDLAAALIELARRGATGTFHAVNSGVATWHAFAEKILEISGITDVRVDPITTEELARNAPRPQYSVLDCTSLARTLGAPLRSWQDALAHYLAHRT